MYILFDIGGTKTRIASSKDGKSFSDPVISETPKDFEEGMRLIERVVGDISGGEKIEMAAGGLAGPLDTHHKRLVNSPNIPGWINKPFVDSFEKIINSPVYIENDSAMVGLGEAVSGAGRGHDIVVYLTISTGVGGARIVNGKIDVNRYGFEPGHQVIDFKGDSCSACNAINKHQKSTGHMETYISGSAIEKRSGKKAYDIDDKNIWSELAGFLAVGLNNTIVHWSPDVVVLGGSMIVGEPSIPIDEVRSNLLELMTIFPEKPKIVKAELADQGGLYGSLAYINQKMTN